MALTGTIKSANVVGTPKPGDALKLKVVYDVEATANEAPWTVAVAALYKGQFIGKDNSTHYVNKLTNNSVEFTCSIKMPSTSINVDIDLYGLPEVGGKIEDYL